MSKFLRFQNDFRKFRFVSDLGFRVYNQRVPPEIFVILKAIPSGRA
jgi:hypothetical protein